MTKKRNEKVHGCQRVLLLHGLSQHHWLQVMRTSSRGDRGDEFDWIREWFLDLYNLNATQSVFVMI